jgi:hypothetical protein
MNIEIAFTPVFIAGLVGAILTIFFAYFPKVRVWFASLAVEVAAMYKLGMMVIVAIVISLLSYYSVIATVPPFSWPTLVAVIIALIITNQPVQALLPETRDVQVARVSREARLSNKLLTPKVA